MDALVVPADPQDPVRVIDLNAGGDQLSSTGDELADSAETARRDLDRIFNTGGVAALVGNTYGAAKDVGVYVTGEAIRGLADLEAKERERCANFASKAVAAGLMKRQVELAEAQGQLMAAAIRAILDDLQLTAEQRQLAPDVVRRHLTSVVSA
jgi:hypothetical protein